MAFRKLKRRNSRETQGKFKGFQGSLKGVRKDEGVEIFLDFIFRNQRSQTPNIASLQEERAKSEFALAI